MSQIPLPEGGACEVMLRLGPTPFSSLIFLQNFFIFMVFACLQKNAGMGRCRQVAGPAGVGSCAPLPAACNDCKERKALEPAQLKRAAQETVVGLEVSLGAARALRFLDRLSMT